MLAMNSYYKYSFGARKRLWLFSAPLLVLLVFLALACSERDASLPMDGAAPADGGVHTDAGAIADGGEVLDSGNADGGLLQDVPPVTLKLIEGCNPFATSKECILPYPSHWYEKKEAASPTGVRLDYPASGIPVGEGNPPFNMENTNLADGVSPAGPIMIHFGRDVNAGQLTGMTGMEKSLEPGAPVALFNYQTGDRVLFMSEMDMNRSDDYPGRYPLIIRPLTAMAMGMRHVLVLTKDLTDANGKSFKTPEAFRVLRDRVPTTNAPIEAVRDRYEAMFAFLEKHGYPRENLALAWDFSVASKDFLLGSVLSMRQVVMDEALGTGLGYKITKVSDNPNKHLSRMVEGTFEVPTFLKEDNTFEYDTAHHPIRQYPNQSFPFTMLIPKCAETRTGPMPLAVFGHGIFGSAKEYLQGWAAGTVQPIAEENGMVIVGTDWIGLSSGDQEIIVKEVLKDLNRISMVTDRLQQSLVNNLTLTELSLGALSTDPQVNVGTGPLIDPERIYYYGVSLGGIQGSSFTAVSNRITRAVLAVPGSVWLNMIPRSTVWSPIKMVAEGIYPDPLALQMAIAFFQTWFDHSDPINLSYLLFDEPPPGSPPDRMLIFQESIGDSLVPNMATEMLARSRNIRLMSPSITEVYGLEKVSSPATRPVLVQYRLKNWDKPAPPETNVPPSSDNGVHADMVFLPHVLKQAAHLLNTGEAVQYCTDSCDPD